MARDDYHVIVYQILAYLYQCLKNGEPVDEKQISFKSDFYNINQKYWIYIMTHLLEDGYIEGIIVNQDINSDTPLIFRLHDCQITPKGIAYLADNSLMEKAKQFFKDAKEIIPFV